MAWKIEFTSSAEKELAKLDKSAAKRILKYLRERVSGDPKSSGKALKGGLSGLWRYRVGDYRVICEINNETITVLVLRVGHRKEIYQS
ncbi:MAG: type II toxin-antitoxin system RelE/ParE family toxin [Chlorobaculum sp.]|nr:type II toxin-antitoxin system RelE/ParE family toxin [Chlorobaculum sp.]